MNTFLTLPKDLLLSQFICHYSAAMLCFCHANLWVVPTIFSELSYTPIPSNLWHLLTNPLRLFHAQNFSQKEKHFSYFILTNSQLCVQLCIQLCVYNYCVTNSQLCVQLYVQLFVQNYVYNYSQLCVEKTIMAAPRYG